MTRNGDFFKTPPTQQAHDYIVESIVLPSRQVLPAGYPGEGKSLLHQNMLYSVAFNAPFLGHFKVTPGNVMFIDSENKWDILNKRCSKIRRGLEIDGFKKQGEVDFQHYSGFLLDDKSTWKRLEPEIKAVKPSIISLDHLRRFHNQNENKSDSMAKVNDGIEWLKSICGSAVIILHHFNKRDRTGTFRDRLRGSSTILADCDVAYEVRALSRRQSLDKVYLEKVGLIFESKKDLTQVPFRIRIEETDEWLKLVYDGSYQPISDPIQDILAHKVFHIFLVDNREYSTKKVINIVDGFASEPEIRECLRFLEHDRALITSERKGLGGAFHYHICPEVTCCPWCNQMTNI